MDSLELFNICQKIKSGKLKLHDGKLYTIEQWQNYTEAVNQVEHYDLLQLTKKIQLKN